MDLTKNIVLVLVISVVSGSPLYKTEVHVKSGGADVFPLGYYEYAPPFPLLMPHASYGSAPPPCPAPCMVDMVPTGQELPLTNANIREFQPALAKLALVAKNTGYEYSYLIYNEETGDQKSHHEKKDGSVVRGQYSLRQPDGIIREVHYTAGSDGFNAQVKNIHPSLEPCENHGHEMEHGSHSVEPQTEGHHTEELTTEAPHLEELHPEEPQPEEPQPVEIHIEEHPDEHEPEHAAEIIDIEIKKGDEPHSEDLKLEIKIDEEGASIKAEELPETTDGPAIDEISVSTEAALEPVLEPIIATAETPLPQPPQIFLSLQDIIRCAQKSAASQGRVQSSPLTYIILGNGGPCL